MEENRSLLFSVVNRLASALRLPLLLALVIGSIAAQAAAPGPQSGNQAPSSTQSQQPQTPPVAVNPKPCEVTVSPSGATNSCAQTQQPQGKPPANQAPTQPAQPSGSGIQVPGAGVSVQEQQNTNQGQAATQPETRITKAQAKDLFNSVDEILGFASEDTGLPVKRKVKRKLITRESMESYINKRMRSDKDTQRMVHEQLVLEKFGLIPPGYDLHREFLRLLGEQVAAYYEPKNRTVNLLDWVQPEIQKPVLAHELTHALQDQTVNLQTWPDDGNQSDKPLPDQQEQVVEEVQAARECVTEGQAMVVLFDYTLAPLGKSVATDPDMVNAMRAGIGDSSDSPIFSAAPMFLKETLMMPYTFGTDFIRTVLINKGKEAAFAGVLHDPPVDTRQVMQPETYLLHQVVPPLIVPDLDKLVAPKYERYDFGEMGEFDVYLLSKQYAGHDAPKDIYPHWRGGYYLAAHDKAAPKDEVSLLYFSRWDSPDAAKSFAKVYGDYVPRRYKNAEQESDACPAPAKDKKGSCPEKVWDTDQGKVRIEVRGDDLLVTEDFDDLTVDKARGIFFYHMTMPGTASQAAASKP